MYLLHLEMRGLTASFRIPHMFKYHRSLPLPSYTSIVGMFGAAIGKDLATSQELFFSLNLKVGIAGSHISEFNDTWRVLTTKKSEFDVVERHILYKPHYHIVFYGDEKSIEICMNAFLKPFYPLSLGRPDDIANALVHTPIEIPIQEHDIIRNTVIAGVHRFQVDSGIYDINDPGDSGPCALLFRLPIHFHFCEGFSYQRIADEFRDFTFIGRQEVRLQKPVKGFTIETKQGNINIPLLEI